MGRTEAAWSADITILETQDSGSGKPVLEPDMRCDVLDSLLLSTAPRVEYRGEHCPALGGIPLLKKLHQGGMSTVFYGVHPVLKTGVAIKVIPFGLLQNDPAMVERFFREARIAAQVHSPHLVNVMEVCEEAGLHFSVMEFVDGLSAREHLEATQQKGSVGLPENEALNICLAATTGLVAAHERDIVHRDIKPHNIMIPWKQPPLQGLDFEHSKLTDLGLARAVFQSPANDSNLTSSGQAMGTPGYMAPEQLEDARFADKRSDVFAMGATLHALLSGQAPFYRDSLMQAVLATINSPHPPLHPQRSDISTKTLALIEHCLAKSPAARFADAIELLAALKECRSV